jgi:starch-binding outer membrane protein, SusD/RagB family
MKKNIIKYFSIGVISLTSLSACQGMFDLDSTQVIFSDDNKLTEPSDTMYSVVGIISKMQQVADRTILLGELRGDLVDLTQSATVDLQQVYNFEVDEDNEYNKPEDYYAIINNCNFFIANADTSVYKDNLSVFIRDYVAVKCYRAWTYLQLAQVYGEVPFVTEPILTEKETFRNYPKKGIKEISEYFLEDIRPFVNVPYPGYGNINGINSQLFFIPIDILLGDLCLWSEKYLEAASYYRSVIFDRSLSNVNKRRYTNLNQFYPSTSRTAAWSTQTLAFEGRPIDNYSSDFSNAGMNTNAICVIPMQTNTFDGVVSDLRNVFNSTIDNYYFNKVTYSDKMRELSTSQSYCKVYQSSPEVAADTVFAPPTNPDNQLYVGDLRLSTIYKKSYVNTTSSAYSTERITNAKIGTHVPIYRTHQVYLRYLEAMNRAGFPKYAFVALKYGLSPSTARYQDSLEIAKGSGYGFFGEFANTNALGVHSKGSGNTAGNKNYMIDTLATLDNKILEVEDLLIDEMALETIFEGTRMSDLIRFADRRGNAYLADRISERKGAARKDMALRTKLMERKNWFLPLK